jgi:hypothetical protein
VELYNITRFLLPKERNATLHGLQNLKYLYFIIYTLIGKIVALLLPILIVVAFIVWKYQKKAVCSISGFSGTSYALVYRSKIPIAPVPYNITVSIENCVDIA